MKKTTIAYEAIKKAIFDCDLLPGEPLDETALANMAGVSRTPLREAMVALEREGFIKIIPHKGAFVSEARAHDVEQIMEVRQALETLAVRLAIPHIPKEEVRRVYNKVISYMESGVIDQEIMLEIDHELHGMIWYYSSNETLQRFLTSMSENIKRMRIRSTLNQGTERLKESVAEHKELLEAMLDDNVKKAEKQMSIHIENAKIHALNIIKIPIDRRS